MTFIFHMVLKGFRSTIELIHVILMLLAVCLNDALKFYGIAMKQLIVYIGMICRLMDCLRSKSKLALTTYKSNFLKSYQNNVNFP